MKQIDAYCELRYGMQVFRTPCVRGSGNPAWNWQFEVGLAVPKGGQAPGAEGECQYVNCLSSVKDCCIHPVFSQARINRRVTTGISVCSTSKC